MDNVGIFIFISIAVLGYLRASYLHMRVQASDKYAIKVLRLIGFLLGSFRKDGIIYLPALLIQLLITTMLPMLALYVDGIASLADLNVCLGALFLIFVILITWVRLRKNS